MRRHCDAVERLRKFLAMSLSDYERGYVHATLDVADRLTMSALDNAFSTIENSMAKRGIRLV